LTVSPGTDLPDQFSVVQSNVHQHIFYV
jgi:hypothetical protein